LTSSFVLFLGDQEPQPTDSGMLCFILWLYIRKTKIWTIRSYFQSI